MKSQNMSNGFALGARHFVFVPNPIKKDISLSSELQLRRLQALSRYHMNGCEQWTTYSTIQPPSHHISFRQLSLLLGENANLQEQQSFSSAITETSPFPKILSWDPLSPQE